MMVPVNSMKVLKHNQDKKFGKEKKILPLTITLSIFGIARAVTWAYSENRNQNMNKGCWLNRMVGASPGIWDPEEIWTRLPFPFFSESSARSASPSLGRPRGQYLFLLGRFPLHMGPWRDVNAPTLPFSFREVGAERLPLTLGVRGACIYFFFDLFLCIWDSTRSISPPLINS